MSRKMFRYPVAITDEQTIAMPQGALILSVQRREGSLVIAGTGSHEAVEMWALVDPDQPPEQRRIRVAGTGHSLPTEEDLEFLGTVQVAGGRAVFHVFEVL